MISHIPLILIYTRMFSLTASPFSPFNPESRARFSTCKTQFQFVWFNVQMLQQRHRCFHLLHNSSISSLWKCPTIHIVTRWWHCHTKFNGDSPRRYTGMFKKGERVGIMWGHTHAFPWELEINRNVWFPKHSRPAAPHGGGGARTLT